MKKFLKDILVLILIVIVVKIFIYFMGFETAMVSILSVLIKDNLTNEYEKIKENDRKSSKTESN